jgi:hypothetical protein
MLVANSVFHFLRLQSFISHGRITELQNEALHFRNRNSLLSAACFISSLIAAMMMEVKYL